MVSIKDIPAEVYSVTELSQNIKQLFSANPSVQ